MKKIIEDVDKAAGPEQSTTSRPEKRKRQTVEPGKGIHQSNLFSYKGYTTNKVGNRTITPLETQLVIHGDNPLKEDPYEVEPINPAEAAKMKGPGKYNPKKASTQQAGRANPSGKNRKPRK